TVHEVALGEAAARTRGPARDVLDDGDRRADLLGHGRHDQRHVAPPGERLALPPGLHGVLEDAEVEVEARRPVPLVDQHVPERERVLAAGDGDEQVLVLLEHAVLPDRLTDLVPEEVDKIRSAKGGVVAAELEYRRPAALPALHCRGAREAGPFGGWPATRGDPAPFLIPLSFHPGSRGRPAPWGAFGVGPTSPLLLGPLIGRGLARPARSVGGLRRGAPRLRSSSPFSFHPGSRGRPVRWAAPPTHDRPQLDGVRVADDLVGRDQLVASDHEDRLREDVELTQDLLHATPTRHLDLTPGVSENDLHRLASPVTPS